MPLLCGAVDGMNTPCQLALSSGPAGAARAPSFVEHAVCWSHGCEVIPPRCLAYTLGRASWAQRRREHSKCIRASKEAWVVQGGPGWSRGRGPATSHSALRWHRPPDHLPKTFPLERDRATQRRTQNAERAGHWHWHWAVDGAWTVDRGPSDSACVRLIVADPAQQQQQQRTHHRLTGRCTPGPGVRGKRDGRRECSSPARVQCSTTLSWLLALSTHTRTTPTPTLACPTDGGCEARLTRRRAALHVSMWCIAV